MRDLRNSVRGKYSRNRRGVALVEFAIVIPLVFLFTFGLIEMARLVMVQQALVNAAREGARLAALTTTTDPATVDTAVRTFLSSSITDAEDVNTVGVSVTPSSLSGMASNTPVTVAVNVNFSDVTWMPGDFLGLLGNVALHSTSTMNRE